MRLARAEHYRILNLVFGRKDDHFGGWHKNVIYEHTLTTIPIYDLQFSLNHLKLHLLVDYDGLGRNLNRLEEKGVPVVMFAQFVDVFGFNTRKEFA